MEISERIGEMSSVYEEEVTPQLVKQFAEAVGSTDTELAPPTLVTRWRRGEFELFTNLGIPLARILHGEQQYSYHAPVRPGTRVTYRTRLKDVISKKGRKTSLNFLTFETDVFARPQGLRAAGGPDAETDAPRVVTSLTTIVVRGEIGGAAAQDGEA